MEPLICKGSFAHQRGVTGASSVAAAFAASSIIIVCVDSRATTQELLERESHWEGVGSAVDGNSLEKEAGFVR